MRSPQMSALYIASKHGRLDEVRELVAAGERVDQAVESGYTPLLISA